MFTITTHNEKETFDLGQRLGKLLGKGDIVCFEGELGTGKTTMIKGIAQALSFDSHQVQSPTFVLMNRYEGRTPIYHFDLYRINGEASLSGMGLDEFLYGKGVSLLEWAERLESFYPTACLQVKLDYKKDDDTKRQITFKAKGDHYARILRSLRLLKKLKS